MHLFWRPARTRASERHRKGIEKHLETLESIGKHRKASERKTSEPPWKNLNKDGNSRSLSDSLICSTKQPHWSLEIAVFCILIPCLFAQQSRLIGCSWQTSPPKENCTSYEAVNDFTQVAWIPKLNREQISCKIVFIWRPFFNWKHKARIYNYYNYIYMCVCMFNRTNTTEPTFWWSLLKSYQVRLA